MYIISSQTELATSYWTGDKTGFGTIFKAELYPTFEEAEARLEFVQSCITAKKNLYRYRGALTYQPPKVEKYEPNL